MTKYPWRSLIELVVCTWLRSFLWPSAVKVYPPSVEYLFHSATDNYQSVEFIVYFCYQSGKWSRTRLYQPPLSTLSKGWEHVGYILCYCIMFLQEVAFFEARRVCLRWWYVSLFLKWCLWFFHLFALTVYFYKMSTISGLLYSSLPWGAAERLFCRGRESQELTLYLQMKRHSLLHAACNQQTVHEQHDGVITSHSMTSAAFKTNKPNGNHWNFACDSVTSNMITHTFWKHAWLSITEAHIWLDSQVGE